MAMCFVAMANMVMPTLTYMVMPACFVAMAKTSRAYVRTFVRKYI